MDFLLLYIFLRIVQLIGKTTGGMCVRVKRSREWNRVELQLTSSNHSIDYSSIVQTEMWVEECERRRRVRNRIKQTQQQVISVSTANRELWAPVDKSKSRSHTQVHALRTGRSRRRASASSPCWWAECDGSLRNTGGKRWQSGACGVTSDTWIKPDLDTHAEFVRNGNIRANFRAVKEHLRSILHWKSKTNIPMALVILWMLRLSWVCHFFSGWFRGGASFGITFKRFFRTRLRNKMWIKANVTYSIMYTYSKNNKNECIRYCRKICANRTQTTSRSFNLVF